MYDDAHSGTWFLGRLCPNFMARDVRFCPEEGREVLQDRHEIFMLHAVCEVSDRSRRSFHAIHAVCA